MLVAVVLLPPQPSSALVSPMPAAQSVAAPSATTPSATTQSAAQVPIVPPVPGVDLEFDERVKRIASRLRCPVCQGESIQDSPAELSSQMKTLVREQLANGKTEAEVLDYFLAKYGQWILLEPRAEGINLLVYWLPVLFLAFGAGGLWFVVRKWTQPRAVPEEGASTVPPPFSASGAGLAGEPEGLGRG